MFEWLRRWFDERVLPDSTTITFYEPRRVSRRSENGKDYLFYLSDAYHRGLLEAQWAAFKADHTPDAQVINREFGSLTEPEGGEQKYWLQVEFVD